MTSHYPPNTGKSPPFFNKKKQKKRRRKRRRREGKGLVGVGLYWRV